MIILEKIHLNTLYNLKHLTTCVSAVRQIIKLTKKEKREREVKANWRTEKSTNDLET